MAKDTPVHCGHQRMGCGKAPMSIWHRCDQQFRHSGKHYCVFCGEEW